MLPIKKCALIVNLMAVVFTVGQAHGQQPPTGVAGQSRSREAEVELGSRIAKGGFENEDAIRARFNGWQHDDVARAWLVAMGYKPEDVVKVEARQPRGEKADVEVAVTTQVGEKIEGVSIKLVSNPNGFNQIDKRWLRTYVEMWDIPPQIHQTLQRFVGEEKPVGKTRDERRMFLNEFPADQQRAVLDFFARHREAIVSDLIAGDGEHAAGWIMVTLRRPDEDADQTEPPTNKELHNANQGNLPNGRWTLCSTAAAVKFFAEGPVELTKAGNLKIGRITMQRKGGDNGRESANMLQFKINPAELFNLKSPAN